MKYQKLWVDDEGVVREIGPFTPMDRVVEYRGGAPSMEELKESILAHYKDTSISHPLNKV